MKLWRFHLALDLGQVCQQAPVAYKLPKQGVRGGGAAAVGAVFNPFVWGVLLIALIPIHLAASSLSDLSRAGFSRY